jgi:thiosulfate/3-mercaptopyruvate sulfurtransferase
MKYSTLISAAQLSQHINDANWVVVDCRYSLADSKAGAKAYRLGHIKGACYADLSQDLSAAITESSGRHPLPNFSALAQKLALWGIGNNTQVIAYDDAGGAFAGRLWWLLRYLGHEQAAVLDGGIQEWQKQGHALSTHLPARKPAAFRAYLNETLCLTAEQVQNGLAKKNICLIDARTPERFRGEQEPIDPVAGHIPGALNRPFQLNLDKNGLFLPAGQLHAQFHKLLGQTHPKHVVHQCGSGVTACHNILAMEHAGLNSSKLYAGSWSEWITNKNRPIAKA